MGIEKIKVKLNAAAQRSLEMQLERLKRMQNLTGEAPVEGSKPQLTGTGKSGNTKGNSGGANPKGA